MHQPSTPPAAAPLAVVIEDDAEIRALHRQLLDQLGMQVVMTTNAADGVAAVREFNPLITFLDVTMPGMDGFAAAARIRAISDTYILMVTGLADEVDVVQGLAAGADDYVLKPFRPRELRARVEAMLRRPRGTAPRHDQSTDEVAEPADLDGLDGLDDLEATLVLAPVPAPAPEPETDLWSVGAPAPSTLSSFAAAVQTGRDTTLLHSARTPGGTAALDLSTRALNAAEPHAALAAASGATALTVVSTPVPDAPEQEGASAPEHEWIRHGSLALHLPSATVTVGDEVVQLEASEAVLLASLMESGTRVRSVANLVLSLRGEGYVTTYYVNDADKRAVVDHVESLRRKIGDTGPTPLWIDPVRAVGFRMTAG